MTRLIRPFLTGLLLIVAGCAQDEAAFGTDPIPNCTVETPLGCVNSIEDACEVGRELTPYCTDQDQDCFFESCSADVPKWVMRTMGDCNGRNPDIHPLANESCDGFDNDCDERVDEYFNVGAPCSECGGGRLECAIDDPARAVCSTLPGQSNGPVLTASEPCDLEDNDCDGRIDESCHLAYEGAGQIDEIAVCDEQLYIVEGQNVMAVSLGDPMSAATPTLVREGTQQIRDFRCSPEGLAWLEADACVDAQRGPARCTGLLWVHAAGAEARAATGLGSYGGVLLSDGLVYFHSLVEGVPYLNRVALAEGAPEPVLERASDPTPPDAAGRIVALRWSEEQQARVEMHDVDEAGVEILIGNPATPPGPPVANGNWVAWRTGNRQNQLWVVPKDDLIHGGFLAVNERSALTALRLVGDSVFFIDTGTNTLQRLDLNNGQRDILADGPFPNEQLRVEGNTLLWVDSNESRPHIRLRNLGESSPE